MGEKDPILVLGGTGLRVYLYLVLKARPAGVREVQRALGFRSPSTARHHLERLVELGLAEKTRDGYVARRTGLLAGYLLFMGRLVPRQAVLSAFLIAATIAYAAVPGWDPVALLVLSAASMACGLEALTAYRYARRLASAVEKGG